MTPTNSPHPTIEQLAEEFLQRYRRGERPALTEYTSRYPELAEEIRDVFAALALVEEAGPRDLAHPAAYCGRVTADGKAPRQLGDYRIIREVGRGGMGVVYEAVQEALGRHVALKVLPYEAAANPTCLDRFTREARAAARLHHTNIVPVYDVGQHQGVHYYAMQFIQGQGLDEVLMELRRLRSSKGSPLMEKNLAQSLAEGVLSGCFAAEEREGEPIPEIQGQESGVGNQISSADSSLTPDSCLLATGQCPSSPQTKSDLSTGSDSQYYRSVARLGLQVAETLAYAHAQKILHRDIKPSNLLLDLRGTIWVTDFGLAKEEGDDLTKTGDVVGTLRYLAPERFNGVSEPRGDIYSLGLTLYEMLTLRAAFDEQDRGRLIRRIAHEEPPAPRKFDRRIPRDLETVVLKAIAKEPKKRYQAADELSEDIRRFLADRPILARRTSWREHAWRWIRRNPGWAATLVATITLLLVVAVGGIVLSLHLQKALTNAQNAEREKTDELRRSLLERAAAKRASGRVGQRFESLQALREAAQIRITPELRNEAAAALVLPDIEPGQEWEAYTADTLEIAFDANYRHYVALDRNGGLKVYRRTGEDAEMIAALPAYGRPPFYRVWMSPDGQYVAYGHTARRAVAGEVRVWRLGPAPSVVLDEPAGMYESALAFSPDSKQLAIGNAAGFISVYDLKSGARRRHFDLGVAPHTLAFHPRDGRLAAACGNGVRLFDVDTGRELPPLRHPRDVTWITGLTWHPDGRRLATGCNDRKIHIWDMESATEVMRPWEGHVEEGIGLTFNHAGDRLASVDWGGQVRFWDAVSGSLLLTIPGPLAVNFSGDDELIGFSRKDNKIRLLRLASGRELRIVRRRLALPGEQIYAAAVDADGRTLAASVQLPPFPGQSGLAFFDVGTGEEVGFAQLPRGQARSTECRVYLQAEGWLTAGTTGLLSWPVRSKSSKPGEVLVGPPRQLASNFSLSGAGVSLDGMVLALPHSREKAVLIDRRNPERRVFLEQSDVRNCAVSPDGRWVVTASHWGDEKERWSNARVWDAERGRHILDLPLRDSTIPGFSPDGRWLATNTRDAGFRLWEVGSWQERLHFADAAFAFSSDSRLLAVGDILGVIRLMEPETGREIGRLTGPEATSYQPVCFTPDGARLIATCSGNKALYVWELRQLRTRLRELGLDWDWPEFLEQSSSPVVSDESSLTATHRSPVTTHSLKVRVDAGFLTQPAIADAQQAVGVYSLALAVCPLNPEAYLQRGWAYSRLKNYDDALRDLEYLLALKMELVGREGLFAFLCNNAAWHSITQASGASDRPGDLARAERVLPLAHKAVELEPDNVIYCNTLGVVLYRLGRYREAIDILEKNSKSDGEFFAFDGYFLAMAYQRLGNPAIAHSWFERSNAWTKDRTDQPAQHLAELATFRSEAATVLGIKLPVEKP